MLVSSFSCPYCNAILTPADAQLKGSRIQCPRCGELFPSPIELNNLPAPNQKEPLNSESQPHRSSTAISNRALALYILAFMGLMALGFFGYAWQTQQIRREHDLRLPKSQSITIPLGIALACDVYIVALIFAILRPQNRPGPLRLTLLLAGISTAVVTAGLLRVHIRVSSESNSSEEVPYLMATRHVRPANLPSLAYLPADTNLIVGFNISSLTESMAGQEILAGKQTGNLLNAQQVRNWIGLDPKEIDYLIAGLRIDQQLLPRIILVIETTRPFETDKIHENLKASRWPDPEAVLFPTNHTIILALNRKDLPQPPANTSASPDHFSTSLRTALKERVEPGAQVWLAGDSPDWEKTIALTYLAALPQKEREVFGKIHTFAVSLRLNKDASIHADMQCRDEPSAQALREYLDSLKPAGLETRTSQKENWTSFQAKGADIASLTKFLSLPNVPLSISDKKSSR
jgi:hypothetical protein